MSHSYTGPSRPTIMTACANKMRGGFRSASSCRAATGATNHCALPATAMGCSAHAALSAFRLPPTPNKGNSLTCVLWATVLNPCVLPLARPRCVATGLLKPYSLGVFRWICSGRAWAAIPVPAFTAVRKCKNEGVAVVSLPFGTGSPGPVPLASRGCVGPCLSLWKLWGRWLWLLCWQPMPCPHVLSVPFNSQWPLRLLAVLRCVVSGSGGCVACRPPWRWQRLPPSPHVVTR